MNKKMQMLLVEKAKEPERNYSNPERALNGNAESFHLQTIKPLSEEVSAWVFLKLLVSSCSFIFCFCDLKRR
jgi:hypothetical protein